MKYSVIREASNSFYHCKNKIVTLELVFYKKQKEPYNSFQELNKKKFSRKIVFLGENTHLKAPCGTDSASNSVAVAVQEGRVL